VVPLSGLSHLRQLDIISTAACGLPLFSPERRWKKGEQFHYKDARPKVLFDPKKFY
jgi:hypothetical protein